MESASEEKIVLTVSGEEIALPAIATARSAPSFAAGNPGKEVKSS
jgi:hypothetical protein